MKFTDGQWLLLPGVDAHYATEPRGFTVAPDALTVHVATKRIQTRGDTLEGPLLTATLSSPMEGVIRVRMEHFTGGAGRRAEIPLAVADRMPVKIEETGETVIVHAGGLSAKLSRKNWDLQFWHEGRVLTRSASRGAAYFLVEDRPYMRDQIALGVGENVYGLGERFTAFIKNGQVVENINKDGGTASEQAYKCVPFYMTNGGYGVLVNETGPVSFEIASERVSRLQFSLEGESIEYFVILGPTPKEVLGRLTALTGRPALPPAWSFGLWLTTSFTTDYSEKTCTEFIEGMRQRRLPLHVFHFDCFWMREFSWCDFQWDPAVFPDPKGMLRRLHERGLRISAWINPYIAQRSALFEAGRAGGYFIKRRDGSVWQTDQWQPGMAIVDFTNPAACEWYATHLRRLLEMGVDTLKTDFGERIPVEDVVYHNGAEPAGMHNLYSILYNECVFRVIEETRGKGDAVVFARSSYASGQRLPVHWGGDCESNFESMAESLRGGLSLGLCGFGFWSHDIGGFEGKPPAALYKRWIAFGLFSSHSRLHGSSSYRVPWLYDEEACDVLRHFTQLKCRLMPYLFAAAVESTRNGVPVMRAMMLEYPDDPACAGLDRQYMLGASLLVAPVFSAEGNVEFYLPEVGGPWTHLLSGKICEGRRWHRERHDFMSLPVYVKAGTMLALGGNEERPDYVYGEGLSVRIYELGEGREASCEILNLDGSVAALVRARRKGQSIQISWEGELRRVRFELAGVDAKPITPESGAHSVTIAI